MNPDSGGWQDCLPKCTCECWFQRKMKQDASLAILSDLLVCKLEKLQTDCSPQRLGASSESNVFTLVGFAANSVRPKVMAMTRRSLASSTVFTPHTVHRALVSWAALLTSDIGARHGSRCRPTCIVSLFCVATCRYTHGLFLYILVSVCKEAYSMGFTTGTLSTAVPLPSAFYGIWWQLPGGMTSVGVHVTSKSGTQQLFYRKSEGARLYVRNKG